MTDVADWTDRREPWVQQRDDSRSPFEIDYGRVVHSSSFRRLQGKTQILNLGDSDFYRTRLTHSLEVAQIAMGIVREARSKNGDHPLVAHLPDDFLIQTVALTHDIGHPPFGHGGEVALNYCMRDQGGFEANGQSLRILAKLEKFSKSAGSNLSRRSLLGILKYPASYSQVSNVELKPALIADTSVFGILDRESSKPPKCYLDTERTVVDWLLQPLSEADRDRFTAMDERPHSHRRAIHKSLDCSIMDVADDIAYGVHDLEDVIALNLVGRDEFQSIVSMEACAQFVESLARRYADEFTANSGYETFVSKLFASDGGVRKRQISRLVHYFIVAVQPSEESLFDEPLLRFRTKLPEAKMELLSKLKQFVFDRVVKSPGVQHLEFKGQQMVLAVFDALRSDPRSFLPRPTFERFEQAGADQRVICDHVAGMTDAFLLRTYERLFSPRMGSVFDRL